jgi:ABC-type sugar transport system ATPase subunit
MNILKITSDNIISNNQINFLGNKVKIDGINFSKKEYYLGLRPEHLGVLENSEYKFNPKVDLIENLGNEKIVYIKMDKYEISAKIPSHHTIENSIGFNSKDIFVFDENGNRVKS